MLLYITLGSNDLARAARFYDAALAPLNIIRHVTKDEEIGYGSSTETDTGRKCRLWIVRPYLKLPATWGNGTLTALEAPSRAAVDAFFKEGIAAGGIDEGAPGLRPYHANFYAAYLRDPDGNKLSAVFEQPV